MRHMKHKGKWILLLTFFLWISGMFVVLAEEETSSSVLDPLIYESLKFKKNTDYLHDGKKLELKNTLPQKQFNIYFDGRKQLPVRDDTSFLFQTSNRGEKSTVSARSQELKLFSVESYSTSLKTTQAPIQDGASSKLPMIIIGLLLITGIGSLLIFILPRLKNEEAAKPLQTKSIGNGGD